MLGLYERPYDVDVQWHSYMWIVICKKNSTGMCVCVIFHIPQICRHCTAKTTFRILLGLFQSPNDVQCATA